MREDDLANLQSQICDDLTADRNGATAYFSSLPPADPQVKKPVPSKPQEPEAEVFEMSPYELVLDIWLDFDDELVDGDPASFRAEELKVLR